MSLELDARLKRLRLGWIAQSFEAQNTHSIREKHSFLEFLSALVDGELEARDNKGLMKRIKELIMRMATDNSSWGYCRIQGELKKLDHRVARSTIAKTLNDNGIAPGGPAGKSPFQSGTDDGGRSGSRRPRIFAR